MVKTTKKDFRLFKKECRKWIDYFGLKQWEVLYFHEKCGGRSGFYTNISGGLCSIILNARFKNVYKITKKDIRIIAFHEVVEGLLFAETRSLLFESGYSRTKIDEVIHPIIRTLENTMFK